MSWLFGANPNPTVTSTDQTSTTFPSWYQSYVNAMLGKSDQVVNEPFQQYTGPRNAPVNADQTSAYNMTRQGLGQYQPQLNTASDYLTKAGAGFNQQDFNSYMNPYTQNVVDRIGVMAGRNLSENILPGVNDSFVNAGQFGSSRNQEFTNRAIRDTQDSALAAQGQALSQGFNSSMGAYQQGQQNQLNAGQQLTGLAQTGQTIGLKDAAALQAIGGEQQQNVQKNYDTAYGDFLEQRNYPRNQAEWLNAQIRGIQPPVNTTSTSTGPAGAGQLAPNNLSQVVGAGVGIGSLLGLFKNGGEVVRRFARGGPVGLSAYRMA